MHRILVPLAFAASLASAQFQDNRTQELKCDDARRWWADKRSHTCSMQDQTIGAVGRLDIGPSHNGAITVKGWDRNDVLVRARIDAWGKNDAVAADVARQVRIEVNAGRVRAEGPDFDDKLFRNDKGGWSVSFEIFTPHKTDLVARTHNGAIELADVSGRMMFETHNGAAELTRVAGDVEGESHNGAIKVELAGTKFDGQRLDVGTHNGAVTLALPSNYSARVEMSTHNGGIDTDFPVTIRGRMDRKNLAFDVGSGGSPIRVRTHNGGIRVRRL